MFLKPLHQSLLLTTTLLLQGCLGSVGTEPAHASTSQTLQRTSNQTVQSCQINRVTDGDSLEALCRRPNGQTSRIKIRLQGIDAPELRQTYGQAARQRLNQLCHNQQIQLPLHPAKDRYGRTLADVTCKGQDAGAYMVQAGFAWYYRATATDYPELVRMEAQAKRQKLGLWGTANPTPPWVWRQQNARTTK